MLASAVAFTFQILLVDHYSPKVDIIRLNCIQFSVMAILSFVPMLELEQPKIGAISDAWLPIVYAGLFSGCGAYTLQMLGQRRVEPTTASFLLSPENVFSALAGWVILGQSPRGSCSAARWCLSRSYPRNCPGASGWGKQAVAQEALPAKAVQPDA